MGFDPFVYWEFKNALDQLELAKINAEREIIGLPPLMPLSDNYFLRRQGRCEGFYGGISGGKSGEGRLRKII